MILQPTSAGGGHVSRYIDYISPLLCCSDYIRILSIDKVAIADIGNILAIIVIFCMIV